MEFKRKSTVAKKLHSVEDLDLYTHLTRLLEMILSRTVNFNRKYKYSVGTKMENLVFESIDYLIEGQESKNNLENRVLNCNNITKSLVKLRLLANIMLSKEQLTIKNFENIQEEIVICSTINSGWKNSALKSLAKKTNDINYFKQVE